MKKKKAQQRKKLKKNTDKNVQIGHEALNEEESESSSSSKSSDNEEENDEKGEKKGKEEGIKLIQRNLSYIDGEYITSSSACGLSSARRCSSDSFACSSLSSRMTGSPPCLET